MPEIWLPYGQVEIVVDVKAENLADVIEPSYPSIDSTNLVERLKDLEVHERALIIVEGYNDSSLTILSILLDTLGQDVHILTTKGGLSNVKKLCEGKSIKVSTLSGVAGVNSIVDGIEIRIPSIFSDFDTKILISEATFDPLFGFRGGPITLLTILDDRLIGEAFKISSYSYPKPGVETEASKFADKIAEKIDDVISIELVSYHGGISEIFVGSVIDTHKKASQKLLEIAKRSLSEPAKAMIVSAGGLNNDLTLASSIKCLWNVIGGLKEQGSIVLIAECSQGLGSEALKLYVSGRLDIAEMIKKGEYIDGLEDLIYLREALTRYKIQLVSTLPHYYV
ncbi:MAG: hypothetical protein N3F06_02630, partial [Nitrososphaerales archaeon]|nr:hypothetical protein [Nitrososphaerales archaeon]